MDVLAFPSFLTCLQNRDWHIKTCLSFSLFSSIFFSPLGKFVLVYGLNRMLKCSWIYPPISKKAELSQYLPSSWSRKYDPSATLRRPRDFLTVVCICVCTVGNSELIYSEYKHTYAYLYWYLLLEFNNSN